MLPSSPPEVAVVLSNYEGLADARPVHAELDEACLEAMLRAALALAGSPAGAGDWVIVKPNIVCCPGLSPQYGPAGVTDLRIVRGLVRYLAERGCARITIAEGAGGWRPGPVDGWTTDWRGAFGGLTYAGIAREFGAELLDLNFAETREHRSSGRVFSLARAIRECHAIVSLSPLKTNKGAGVSLAMKNLFGIAPGSVYGFPKFGLHALGPVPDLISDIFSYRPDTYGIVGGPWGVEGQADSPVRHNILIAGAHCPSVDAAGAAVMGFEPDELDFLRIAERRGFGPVRPGSILVRGNSISQARRTFRRSAQWEAACR